MGLHCRPLMDDGEEGRGGAAGGLWLLGLVCLPLAVVFRVSDAPEQTPWGGCSHLLKADGREGESSLGGEGGLGLLCRTLKDGRAEGRGGAGGRLGLLGLVCFPLAVVSGVSDAPELTPWGDRSRPL